MEIGVQLYTLRDRTQNVHDFEKTIEFLSKLGIKVIQLSGCGNFPIEQKKEILDKYNIKTCATHNSCDRFENDLNEIIREQRLLNCDIAGLSCLDNQHNNDSFIKHFSQIASELKKEGLQFAYHNHGFEFKKDRNGVSLMDRLIDQTNIDDFHFIVDLCWAKIAKQDPINFLEKIKNRVEVVHIKDYKKGLFKNKFVSLGKGNCDIKNFLNYSAKYNIPYALYEQDNNFTSKDSYEETLISYNILSTLFKTLSL